MRVIGSKGVVLLALVVAMLIALPSMTSALAATALMVGGIGGSVNSDYLMSQALNRKFTGVDPKSGTPWQRVSVYWPAQAAPYWGTVSLRQSVAEGTANLVQAIKTTYSSGGGPITVVGMSAGNLVVDEAMRELANDPTAPPKTALNFVVIADATQRLAYGTPGNFLDTISGYTYQPPPQTPYDVTVVTYEYDGWADFPDRPWNLLADANALAGALLLHLATWYVDLSKVPASNIKVTTNPDGGVTTSYLVEPQTLPLVQLFPQLAPQQDSLKQLIDAGYSRNDATTGSSSAPSVLTASAVTASAETASLATASPAIAPNGQSSASTNDAPAGAATNSVAERAQSQQGLANAPTARIDATAAPVSSTPAPVNGTQGTANAAVGVAKATPPADPQLANAAQAVANGAADLTGGKNVTASTNGANPGLHGKSITESVRDTATKPVQNSIDKLGGLTGAGTVHAQTAGQAGAGSGGAKSGG